MTALQPATRDAVTALIDAIHADPAAPWTAEAMSRRVSYSRSHLDDAFRRHTAEFRPPLVGAGGLSPRAYLITVRMLAAKRLLATTDLTVTDIAGRVGYQAHNVFAKQFWLEHGMCPTAYRRRARGGAR